MKTIQEIFTPNLIGERLKLVRQGLHLTQQEVAVELKCAPLTISRIERGEVVVTTVFIQLLAFYSQSISLDVLFSPKIDSENYYDLFSSSTALHSLTKEKLRTLREETEEYQKQVLETLDDAIDLI